MCNTVFSVTLKAFQGPLTHLFPYVFSVLKLNPNAQILIPVVKILIPYLLVKSPQMVYSFLVRERVKLVIISRTEPVTYLFM